ncbi:hypothetical protein [Hymenobacter sp.]|uniref:hypothetical protein n=1 Tax=Hymenobacter sp. TaxID=1898978 RepID=UPI00286A08BE|nr:hypothetical protein [Hymenobacter sp.]
MEALELAQEIHALPERARVAMEGLVLLLNKPVDAAVKRQPPILYAADPVQAGQSFADPELFGAWADRTDIADGAEYIPRCGAGCGRPDERVGAI